MNKAKEVADAAAMGGDVASGSSDSCDVFLSFVETDVHPWVGSLYEWLARVGIRAFRDSEGLQFGDEIDGKLLRAIDGAKIYIPIFSERYASSKRRLQELAAMVKSKEKSGRGKTIFPLFYAVEYDDVRLETPLYREELVKHEKRIGPEEVEAWENALKEVASLRGRKFKYYSPYKVMEGVVEEVIHKVKVNQGIAKQVEDMMDLLDLEVSDVRIVGIWGKDGVGKTTLAKLIYEQISSQFDSCSFLADIGATAKQPQGFWHLKSKLMSDILDPECEVDPVAKGVDSLKGTLQMIKVLIVLDDVDEWSHLNQIVGKERDWFGHGSRIIVTTSDKSVLSNLTPQLQDGIPPWLDCIYCIGMMNDHQALELFSKHALRGNPPCPDFDEIATGIIDSVNGIPLFIEVIGSLLSRKVVEEWTALKELILQPGLDIKKRFMFSYEEMSKELILQPDLDIKNLFTVSYEELSKEQREIFLDIACLPADVDGRIASFMWHNPNFPPSDGVDALHAMSLVKIGKNNELGMHRLLREFGQQIIQKEDKLHPETQGRLYSLELAQTAKTMKEERWRKSLVEKCYRSAKRLQLPYWRAKRMMVRLYLHLFQEDFERMPNMRFLILDCATFAGYFARVFPNLKWLQWRGYTGDFIAINFHVEKLVVLDLSWSKVTADWGGWRGIKMPHLKSLNLTGCADLSISPDFSSFPDLEILILERCFRLTELDPSICDLKHLTTLNLRFCGKLNMLPIELGDMEALKELLIDGTSVQEIPESVGDLKKLEIISASNCLKLSHLPDSVCGLTALSVLSLENAEITRIPASVDELVKLRILSLKGCWRIWRLPDSICNLGSSLEELDITGTGISELPNSIACLGRLKVLKMDSCSIRELPREIGNLVNLEELHASHCRSLKGAIPTAIRSLDRLRILRLGRSSISGIPLEIGSLSCLQTLELLWCNEIQVLPELPSSLTCLRVISKRMEALPDLQGLVKLEEICLGDKDPNERICPSTQMEPKSRSRDLLVVPIVLPKLKMLKLSHSRIRELQLGHGSLSCTHLKKLFLSGVNLETVPELPSSLSVLSIRGCPSLRQLPAVHHLSKLSALYLSQSAVEEIEGLQGLIALEILNISHCEISNLNGIGQLTELRHLILSDCNSLDGLPDISNLKMLNVKEVRRCRMIPAI